MQHHYSAVAQRSLQKYSFFSWMQSAQRATESQSDGRLGVNLEPGARGAFSQFTSTIQILNRAARE